jgi:hypothetical protein
MSWAVETNAQWMEKAARLTRERSQIEDISNAVMRHAVRRNLPKMKDQGFRAALRNNLRNPASTSTNQHSPAASILKGLEDDDRCVLLDDVAVSLAEVVAGGYNVQQDAAAAEQGQQLLAAEPDLKDVSPAFCWGVQHYKELEEYLPEIAVECAPSAPGNEHDDDEEDAGGVLCSCLHPQCAACGLCIAAEGCMAHHIKQLMQACWRCSQPTCSICLMCQLCMPTRLPNMPPACHIDRKCA